METKIAAIARELNNSIQLKNLDVTSNDGTLIISILKEGFVLVKSLICDYEFESKEAEIHFFKETKPQMFFKLIYYNKMQNIEQHRPACGYNAINEYLEKEQESVNYFFHKNNEFIQYYKSGNTMLDEFYFLRNSPEIECNVDSFSFERDANFSTNYDFKVMEVLANELLITYLHQELSKLRHDKLDYSNGSSSVDVWTDLKVALVELIYAIHAARSVNHGNISIKMLTAIFEQMFHIDLGDFYRIFLEIRSRKGSRTTYLDRLAAALNKEMDEKDSK